MLKRIIAVTLVAATIAITLGANAVTHQVRAKPSRYLYVWAGTGTKTKTGLDMIAVIDANPSSAKYGKVINVLTVDTAGTMPHHSELELPKNGPLFVNDYAADRSYLIDFKDPAHPSVAAQMMNEPGGRKTHSFARLPNGHVLATVQFGNGMITGDPGSIAEFNNDGVMIRSSSSADSAFGNAAIRTYSLTILPVIDRVVTTSSPMDNERAANVVQVWRMSDLKLLKTLAVPVVTTDSAYMYPFELKTLADGKTVMMNTYYCGFYKISALDTDPKIERVMVMQHPKNIGCSVPLLTGKFMVMPIAYGHRYATLDISNPSHPVEVASFATDSTFYPHWISRDPGSDRVVVTDQGDGMPMVRVGHFDSATGKLRWDDRFKLDFMNVSWPNGVKGMVMPHGAVFVP